MKTILSVFIVLSSLVLNANQNAKKSDYSVDYSIDIPITLTASLIALMPSFVVPNAPEYMKDSKLDKNEINSLDSLTLYNYDKNSAKLSDAGIVGVAVCPLLVNLIDNDISSYISQSVIFIETLAVSSALNNIVKYSVSRPRPYIYSDKADEEEKNNRDAYLSFYSGHSSFAFAGAVSFSVMMTKRVKEFKIKTLIWTTSLFLAGGVAYLRVKAGKHFITDVISGAVIGSSIGYLIPYLHQNDNKINVFADKDSFSVTLTGRF